MPLELPHLWISSIEEIGCEILLVIIFWIWIIVIKVNNKQCLNFLINNESVYEAKHLLNLCVLKRVVNFTEKGTIKYGPRNVCDIFFFYVPFNEVAVWNWLLRYICWLIFPQLSACRPPVLSTSVCYFYVYLLADL